MGSLGKAVLDLTVDPTKVDAGLNAGKSKITGALGGMKSQLSTFGIAAGTMMGNMAANAAMAIGSSIMTAAKNSLKGFLDYAEQVRATSRSLGVGAEESSRLIQVADDLKISYDQMSTAMKMAQKDGVEPSIEGLAKLSDQYLSLQPGVERTQFLLSTFGKSGLEMAAMMEKGGDGIRSMSAAVDENMILTQEALDQARAYEISVDALNDAWSAFTYQVAPPLLSATKTIIDSWRWAGIIIEKVKDGMPIKEAAEFAYAEIEAADAATALARANEDATGTFDEAAAGMSTEEQAAKDLEEQMKKLSDANRDAFGFIQKYADFQHNYNEQHADAIENQRDAQREYFEALREHGKGSDEVAKATEKVEEQNRAVQKLEASWHEATQRMIYDMVLAKVQIDGFTDAEFAAMQQLAVEMGIMTQAEADHAMEMLDMANARILLIENQVSTQQELTKATWETVDAQTALINATGVTNDVGETNYPIGIGSRDSGGPGKKGTPYFIGKGAQPELFVPDADGTFYPNGTYDDMLGSAFSNFDNLNAMGSMDDNASYTQALRRIGSQGGQASNKSTSINTTINNPLPERAGDSMDGKLRKLSYLGVIK